MRIPRFISSKSALLGQHISDPQAGCRVLVTEHYHHLRNVLRFSAGATLELFFPEGRVNARCVLESLSSTEAIARIESINPAPSARRIVLIVGLVRPQKCELIIEKAVELGAAEILFYNAERSRYEGDAALKLARFERIRDSAVKQSHTSWRPAIDIQPNLAAILHSIHEPLAQDSPASARLVCALPHNVSGSETGPIDAAQQGQSPLEAFRNCVDFYLIIGPEGGLSETELTVISQFKYTPLSLGPNILRTETAAIVACGLLQIL